jgi:DNA-binding transcriptional regulator YiaG
MNLTEGKPLTDLYERRVQNGQDLFVILDDRHNRRGTGKTVLSLGLANALDRTDEGLTQDKVTLSVDDLIQSYTEQPRGSALVLDEAEVSVSKYRAGSHTNMAVRELVSMGRIEEKYVVMNLPSSGEMDRDLKALADVWVMVEEKGLATVHFLGWNPYREHPLTPKKQTLRWTDLTDENLTELYQYLTEKKEAHLRGENEESQLIQPDEHQQQVKEVEEKAEKQTRNELIHELYETTDLTQQEIADSVGLSRSRVADILRDRAEA